MKQKIVIKVPMKCQKCKSKAMKIAVKANGVSKVEIQGDEKDQLVVIGDEVDSVNLTRLLRKNFVYANLLSVQEEKDKEGEKKKEEKKEEKQETWPAIYCQCPPYPVLAYDQPNPFCSIL